MLTFLRSTACAAVAVATTIVAAPSTAQAQAYPIDCAILLCLAGGWPKSPECGLAYTTFIRRITPWPIEPPLQIWRCPMNASSLTDPNSPMERLFNASFAARSPQPVQTPLPTILPAVTNSRDLPSKETSIFQLIAGQVLSGTDIADVDISDPIYDFVRSIRVWHVEHYSHTKTSGRDARCEESYSIRLGTYGTQGSFSWARTGPGQAPRFVIPSRACTRHARRRGVGLEWKDYEGQYGFEWVSY
ncbi:MAG: hypothetical protein ABJH07_07095 [Sedimentitalea sp.]|uniref:hypothetical protein n=2 Tax=Sedimentitalea sp. TaxID=2048915 RepID=UPI0032980875